MWNDISNEWKIAFSEGWTAFKNGSTPIGAALFDKDRNLITQNRNRAGEEGTLNKRTSHAEANILHNIDTSIYDLHEMTLYSTMEPCPMCMGTCVMAGVRHLRFAARDPYCGFTYLKDTEPYFKTIPLWMMKWSLYSWLYKAIVSFVIWSRVRLIRCTEHFTSLFLK